MLRHTKAFLAGTLGINGLNNIKLSRLNDDDSGKLDSSVTFQECEAAARDMCKGTSPGPDRIPPEFYLTFWPLTAVCGYDSTFHQSVIFF